MIITTPGKYRLTQDWSSRNAASICHIPKGTIIEVTQIDHVYGKVMVKQFLDWEHNCIPCELFVQQRGTFMDKILRFIKDHRNCKPAITRKEPK